MKIWAHRGLSGKYPENTVESFAASCKYDITGIELDIQLTKDGEIVVIHDETVDRTTDGKGYVKDYTLEEIKKLNIYYGDSFLHIPTIDEVFEAVGKYCRERGVLINIELKNSEIRYEGMERMILDRVARYGLEDYIVYSSFNPGSLKVLKDMDPSLDIGTLGVGVRECKEYAKDLGITVIHPFIKKIGEEPIDEGWTVRCWNIMKFEPFYPDMGETEVYDFDDLARQGVTDIFTNNADLYCKRVED